MDKDARDAYRAVSELVRIYQFRDRKSIYYYDISVTQCYALTAIIKQGPMTLNALAKELYLDKSTASRVVGALARKGYVRRSAVPGDARARLLEVTVQGRRLHSKIAKGLVEEMKILVGDYDRDTRRATIRLIGRLADAASKRFGRSGSEGTGKG